MKVIGLTGGTGSGKSVVSRRLMAHGAFIIDADRIAHEMIEKGKPAYHDIIAYFGEEILDECGNIIRKKLGNIVFSNREKLDFLNLCTHKYIGEEILSQIRYTKEKDIHRCIIIDAPLLLEADLAGLCDEIWVVFAEESVRARRVMERDSITYQQAKERIGSQKSWEEYKKYADVIIDNSRDLAFLETQIEEILKML